MGSTLATLDRLGEWGGRMGSTLDGLLPEGAHLRASSGLTWVSEDFIDRADRRCNRMTECCTESIKSGF